MGDFFVYDIWPHEKKRLRKLYKGILSGKAEITALDLDDADAIVDMIGSELASMSLKCHRYEIVASQLRKRISRLESIDDKVVAHRNLKANEMRLTIFGDTIAFPYKSSKEEIIQPWDLVDERTKNLFLAMKKNEVLLEDHYCPID